MSSTDVADDGSPGPRDLSKTLPSKEDEHEDEQSYGAVDRREDGAPSDQSDRPTAHISAEICDDQCNGAKEESTDEGLVSKTPLCYVPRRFIVTFMTGLGMMLIYAMRTNIGVTVITILDETVHTKLGTKEAVFNLPSVNWDTRMVGFVHSVFYIGYMVTHIPGGYLTTVSPSHRLFGGCILISAALNLLLPVAIEEVGYWMTCAVRGCQGLSEGLLYPACYGVLRHWTTSQERGRAVSSVLTGASAGAILGFPVGGLVTHFIGWQYVYYICGGICMLWYLFWLSLVFEKPSHHPSISDDELEYIHNSQGKDSVDYENDKVPYCRILTSLPVIAVCLCHFARNWIFILILTNGPYYLNQFQFSLAENGVLSSLPHIAKVAASLLSGCIADLLLTDELLTTTVVRKFLTAIGLGTCALCLWMMTVLEVAGIVIIFLTLGLGFFGLSVSGWQINHYDLSPRYASVLVSLSSLFGAFAAIIVPIVTGELTATGDIDGWNRVFYVTSGILGFAAVFFVIFGSGNKQPWADPPANVQLVQKMDPLAKRRYKYFEPQPSLDITSPEQYDHEMKSTAEVKAMADLTRSLARNLSDDRDHHKGD